MNTLFRRFGLMLVSILMLYAGVLLLYPEILPIFPTVEYKGDMILSIGSSAAISSIIGITLIAVSLIVFAYWWISRTRLFSTEEVRYEERSSSDRQSFYNLQKEINEIKSKHISRNEVLDIISSLEENADLSGFKKAIVDEIDLDQILNQRSSEINKELAQSLVRQEFERIRDNLIDYRKSNRNQYSINLFMGLTLGLGAIGIAAYLIIGGANEKIITEGGTPNIARAIAFYVPWITIIIIIEFLALFFLKLYRENIHTERYLRDEITSIGLKISGVEAAIRLDDNTLNKKIAESLLNSDRHQILSKGQTTVEVEKARLDKESFKESIDFLSAMTPWDTAKKAMARGRIGLPGNKSRKAKAPPP